MPGRSLVFYDSATVASASSYCCIQAYGTIVASIEITYKGMVAQTAVIYINKKQFATIQRNVKILELLQIV